MAGREKAFTHKYRAQNDLLDHNTVAIDGPQTIRALPVLGVGFANFESADPIID